MIIRIIALAWLMSPRKRIDPAMNETSTVRMTLTNKALPKRTGISLLSLEACIKKTCSPPKPVKSGKTVAAVR